VIDILRRTAKPSQRSGWRIRLWYQVLDCRTSPGNYLEASASCMFVYALAKGVREEWLAASLAKLRSVVMRAFFSS
jgi:unsaturated rhamnogalacturonyl hydrolase